jgi:cytochrome d ubiquinol oxidase subunit I
MLRGRRDRYHRLGFIIPFTVAAIMTPIQMGVGDSLARFVYNNEPAKFAAIELVPKTNKDVPERLFGHMNSNGTVSGGIPIPGLASWLSDPNTGKNTIVEGREANPSLGSAGKAAVSPITDGPTIAEANAVHLAWDVMVGLGTLLALLSVWYGLSWAIRRDYPKTKWFLRIASCTGVLAVVTMEAGWVVTEVGRQPWIVHNYMKVEQAATANTGVWITFLAVLVIYAVVGATTILVLRGMSKRYREAGKLDESDTPYGPSDPGILAHSPEELPVG